MCTVCFATCSLVAISERRRHKGHARARGSAEAKFEDLQGHEQDKCATIPGACVCVQGRSRTRVVDDTAEWRACTHVLHNERLSQQVPPDTSWHRRARERHQHCPHSHSRARKGKTAERSGTRILQHAHSWSLPPSTQQDTGHWPGTPCIAAGAVSAFRELATPKTTKNLAPVDLCTKLYQRVHTDNVKHERAVSRKSSSHCRGRFSSTITMA